MRILWIAALAIALAATPALAGGPGRSPTSAGIPGTRGHDVLSGGGSDYNSRLVGATVGGVVGTAAGALLTKNGKYAAEAGIIGAFGGAAICGGCHSRREKARGYSSGFNAGDGRPSVGGPD